MRFQSKKWLLLSAGILFLAGACSRPVVQEEAVSGNSAPVQKKILQWKGTVTPEFFLVEFDKAQDGRNDAALKELGVASMEPLFNMSVNTEEKKALGMDRWYVVYPEPGAILDQVVDAMASLDQVSCVEYNVTTEVAESEIYPAWEMPLTKGLSQAFNDPMLSDQWHYENTGSAAIASTAVRGADINVKDVWRNITCGDPSIIVAVADWGVKYTHPDLRDNMWVNQGEIPGNGIDDDNNGYIDDVYGYNFVRKNADIVWHASGHGTHCAGTIAAVNNNGRGVAGVAGGSGNRDGCRIMSCQVLDSEDGSGSPYVTAKAAEYAADNGASVISCSIGYSYAFASDNDYVSMQGSAEIKALHYFESHSNNPAVNGGIAVFSAGNERHPYAHYPGAYYDIISVSAFGPDYMPAPYTNYGPGCNITAPGGNGVLGTKANVLSTVPFELYESDYGYANGTSMACPHVSGVVALGLSYAVQTGRHFDHDEFKRMILASSDDIDQRIAKSSDKEMGKYFHQMGTGAIDAWRLMMKIEGTPTSTAQIGELQWIDLTPIFGTASISLTYLEVEVPQATVDALGLQTVKGTDNKDYPCIPEGDCYAYVQFGRLYIHPTKIGSGKFAITAVGGGDHLGGGDNPPGGIELKQELSIIARDVPGGNGTGGWL